jgi:preprotein translocase subunit SecF
MNYKRTALIPIIFLIVCSVYLVFLIQTNQIELDIDFKGGTQIFATSTRQVSDTELENVLKQ